MAKPTAQAHRGRHQFVGDLGDPIVAAIAAALPPGGTTLDVPGDLPALDPADGPLVLHRAVLTAHDGSRLAQFRSGRSPQRVVLCHGPHVRHGDLERWSAWLDVAIPEATAADLVARHLLGGESRPSPTSSPPRPTVTVVSRDEALRQTLVAAVDAAGHRAHPARDWTQALPEGPAVWDVPVLEPDWLDLVPRRARCGPLILLLGFADRHDVAAARQRGAAACLELPLDLADLADVLDRVTVGRGEPGHHVPPPPASQRGRPARARRIAGDPAGA